MTRIKPTETGPIPKRGKRRRRKHEKKCLDKLLPWSRVAKFEADKACFPIFHGMTCFLCCSREGSAGHHIIPRSESSYFRHDIRNLLPLCHVCHCRVENGAAARHLMILAIHCADPLWSEWIDWACAEKFRVVKEGIKPDFVRAAKWWEAHELSDMTVEEDRRAMLEQWAKVRTKRSLEEGGR